MRFGDAIAHRNQSKIDTRISRIGLNCNDGRSDLTENAKNKKPAMGIMEDHKLANRWDTQCPLLANSGHRSFVLTVKIVAALLK